MKVDQKPHGPWSASVLHGKHSMRENSVLERSDMVSSMEEMGTKTEICRVCDFMGNQSCSCNGKEITAPALDHKGATDVHSHSV